MTFIEKSKLPRLSKEFYRGRAIVFWTHTMEARATGWLSEAFHAKFRELLLHTCARHRLVCPAYVLMPDHWHLIWIGVHEESDQLTATAFLRKHVAPILAPARLQDRAHDHVLKEKERERRVFQATCHYVRENPTRAELAPEWQVWPYAGAIIAGYPQLDPREEDLWDRFWRIHNTLVEGEA